MRRRRKERKKRQESGIECTYQHELDNRDFEWFRSCYWPCNDMSGEAGMGNEEKKR